MTSSCGSTSGRTVSVPLLGSEGVLGAIAISSEMPGRFGPADLSIAEDIARRAAANIEHAYLYRDARQFIATVDATLDAVFMFEPASLRFTYVNQGAVAQVGYEPGQLLAMRRDRHQARFRRGALPGASRP